MSDVKPVPQVTSVTSTGIWRVGRKADPYAVRQQPALRLDDTTSGNRFDSISGRFETVYYATTQRGAFYEVLQGFAPDPRLVALVAEEWATAGHMEPGSMPAIWREERLLVRAALPGRYLDVEDTQTRAFLSSELRSFLAVMGLRSITVPVVRGDNRLVTRFVAEWAWSQIDRTGAPLYAGVRYASKLDSGSECWAAFRRVDPLTGLEVHPPREIERLAILKNERHLKEIADLLGLVVH